MPRYLIDLDQGSGVLVAVTIGSRALSFSDPYNHFLCLSDRKSVPMSVCIFRMLLLREFLSE